MSFHVERLLRLIESVNSSFEEGVLHLVVLLLLHGDLLCRLVVSELACLAENGYIRRWVYFL